MTQFNRTIPRAFLYLSPVPFFSFLSENFGVFTGLFRQPGFLAAFTALFVLWVAAGIGSLGLLVFDSDRRETVLARLANIRERDEREAQAVGRATRQTFLIMLAVLLFLLGVSTFRYGEGFQDPSGAKHHSLTLGPWGLIENRAEVTHRKAPDGEVREVRFREILPVSKTGLLAILILLQLAVYHFAARRSFGERGIPLPAVLFGAFLLAAAIFARPRYTVWSKLPDLLSIAESGDPEAENRAGEAFLFGHGVERDFSEALRWFLKASDHGNAAAPNHIGRLYLNGEGVTRDPIAACKWYRLSAERGDEAGIENARHCPTGEAED